MEFIEFTEDKVKIWGWVLDLGWGWDWRGWDRRRWEGRRKKKRKRKKKYKGNSVLSKNLIGAKYQKIIYDN